MFLVNNYNIVHQPAPPPHESTDRGFSSQHVRDNVIKMPSINSAGCNQGSNVQCAVPARMSPFVCCEENGRSIDNMYTDQDRAFTGSESCSIVHMFVMI